MKIETKFSIGDTCYFFMLDKVREAVIEEIETRNTKEQSRVMYTIDKNPAGALYTNRFLEQTLFKTKQDLLDAL